MRVSAAVKSPTIITEELKSGRTESCHTLQNTTANVGGKMVVPFQFKIEITNKSEESNSTIVHSQVRDRRSSHVSSPTNEPGPEEEQPRRRKLPHRIANRQTSSLKTLIDRIRVSNENKKKAYIS